MLLLSWVWLGTQTYTHVRTHTHARARIQSDVMRETDSTDAPAKRGDRTLISQTVYTEKESLYMYRRENQTPIMRKDVMIALLGETLTPTWSWHFDWLWFGELVHSVCPGHHPLDVLLWKANEELDMTWRVPISKEDTRTRYTLYWIDRMHSNVLYGVNDSSWLVDNDNV